MEQKKEALGGEQKERLDFYASGDVTANGRPSHTGGHVSATVRAAWLLEQTPGVRRGWFIQSPHRKTTSWYF